ncbi:hypothetical protein BGW80DRAFT_1335394 [Lactifluus volemus]|nr:hypothetical protein BGW80DRAFT_1335394 [Lactifluus volemus]
MPDIELETTHVQDGQPTLVSSTTQEEAHQPRNWRRWAPCLPIEFKFRVTTHFLFTTVLSVILGIVKTESSHHSEGALDWVVVFLPFIYGLLTELRRQYPEIWQWFFESDCLSPILTFVHHPFGHLVLFTVIVTFLASFPLMKLDYARREPSRAENWVSQADSRFHDTHVTRALFKTSLASFMTIIILLWFYVFLWVIATIAHRRLNHLDHNLNHDRVKGKLEAMGHLTLYMWELLKENGSLPIRLLSLCWATSTTIVVFMLNRDSQLGEHESGVRFVYSDTPQPHYYTVIQQRYAVLVLRDILPRLHLQSSLNLIGICSIFCNKYTISKRTSTCLMFLCMVPGFAVSLYFGELVGAKFVSAMIWCRFIMVLSTCGSLAALLIKWRDYKVTLLKVWDWVLRK